MTYLGQVVELAGSEELHDRPRHPYADAPLSAASVADPDQAGLPGSGSCSRRRAVHDRAAPGCRFHPRCVVANLVVDLLYAVLDPRVRLG